MHDQISAHLPTADVVAGGLYGTLGVPARVDARHLHEARERAREVMELLGVDELAARDIMTLSTGQARRVLIARALVHDPDVLVFDEPCTGLDPEGMYYVRSSMRTLAKAGKGIVLVTHYPEDIIPEIKRVVLLKNGTVFADGSKDRLLTDGVMSELFDVPLHVQRMIAGRSTEPATQTSHSAASPTTSPRSAVPHSTLPRSVVDAASTSSIPCASSAKSASPCVQADENFDDAREEEYFSLVSAY